jgi:hypothetical protein
LRSAFPVLLLLDAGAAFLLLRTASDVEARKIAAPNENITSAIRAILGLAFLEKDRRNEKGFDIDNSPS